MKTDNIVKLENDEISSAIEEANEILDTSVYVHTLKKPFTYEGKTYETLHFDFEALTGNDCLSIERELQSKGILVAAREFNLEYQLRFAARACKEGMASNVMSALPAREFNAICNRVRSFLLRAE